MTDPAATATRRPRTLSWALAAVAAVTLLALAPYLPAGWRALAAYPHTGADTGGVRGFVTVQTCQRASLWAWTCAGSFEPDDPEAQPYPLTPAVALADDASSHQPGDQVSVTLNRGSLQAYRYGDLAHGRTLLLWAAAAAATIALLLSLLRPARAKAPTAALALSFAALLVAHPF